MNRNYISGRAKEYRTKKKLERHGWICLRTAGSHGFADLVCVNKEEGTIKFIQCKPKRFSHKKKKMLEEEYKWLFQEWDAEFEVI